MRVIDFLESEDYIEKIEGDNSKRVITKGYYDYLVKKINKSMLKDYEDITAKHHEHFKLGEYDEKELNAIDYKINGIKCDNPNCDFRDDTVKFEDYPLWLNKPCPKCGCNLLTKKDLETTKTLIKLVNIINWVIHPFMFIFKKGKRVKTSVEMDGTGEVNFKRID